MYDRVGKQFVFSFLYAIIQANRRNGDDMLSDKESILENAKREISELVEHLNSTTACFTGYRSQKLPWGFNENDERCLTMKNKLRNIIKTAIQDGYNTFLCGMAIGFDMICAETVLDFKKVYPGIKLIGAIPCKDQDKLWSDKDKKRYKILLKKLDGIRCVYNKYIGAECMLERNAYMVKKSTLLIALYDGKTGGTEKTISLAKEQGLKIIIIEP